MTPEQAKELKEIREELNKLKKRNNELEKESVEYGKKKNETADEYVKRLLKEQDILGRSHRLEMDRAALAGDKLVMQDKLFKLEEEYAKMSDMALAAQQEGNHELFEQYKENIKTHEEEIALLKKKGIVGKELSKADLAAKKEMEKQVGSIAKKSLLFTQAEGTFVGSFFNLASSMKEAHNNGELAGNALKKYFSASTFATSMVTKTVEATIAMAFALDKANTSFAAATGLGNKYQQTMLDIRQEGNTMGVTFDNTSNSLKALTENMVGFVRMSEQARASLAMTVAQFERIGIDANTSAQSINMFTLNMGKSEKQAMRMTKELALMGQSAGISAGKMTKDFQTAFKSLAVYGEKSIEVFQGLASAARAAGVEVATLTSLASKFDTFAGSAETVGKLNALLGSQLSSTEMLMMTEDQRIETLVQQVQAQGVNFKDMNKFQQMAIANAAGINDMNEAQRIFGMNMKDYKKYRKDMERQEDIQKKFNEAIEATIPLGEKMQIFMTNFAQAVMPLVKGMEKFMDFMIMITSNKTITGWVALAGAIYLVYYAWNSGLQALRTAREAANATAKMGLNIEKMLDLQRKQAAVQQKQDIVQTNQETQSNLRNAQSKKISGDASASMGKKSAVAGKSAGKGALGMLKFAAAVLLIGAGIWMATTGVAKMVNSFIELAKAGPEAIATIYKFALSMNYLMASAALGVFGAGGIYLSMLSIKAGLKEVGKVLEDNKALQDGLENLALVTTGKGAAAMKAGGITLAGDLKAAVNAAMTQKLEVVIKLKDSALKDMVEDVVVNSISNDGRVAKAVASIG